MDSRDYGFQGETPDVHGSAHVSRESTLVGDVRVGPNATVWPGAVLRGDVAPVVVGEESLIAENVTVHAAELGEGTMVGSGAVVNDAWIGDGCLLGFNAVVSDAEIGDGSVVAAGAICRFGSEIPPESFVYGHPGQARPLEETGLDAEGLSEEYKTGQYANLAARHDDLFE